MKIIQTIDIALSPKKLWPLLTLFEEIQKWTPSLIEEEILSTGTPGPGFQTKLKILEGGQFSYYDSEILTYAPHQDLSIQLSGGNLGKNPMIVTYQMTATDFGTRLTYTSTWQPAGIGLKLLSPIITKVSKKNAAQQMANLKTVAER